MSGPVLHIAFGRYAAAHLGKALENLKYDKRCEAVLTYSDDLSYGPIDPPDPQARWDWAKREANLPRHERKQFLEMDRFWDSALSAPGRRVVWLTRRSPQDYMGFLHWVSRLGDAAYDVVDLTDAEILVRTPGYEKSRRLYGITNLDPDDIWRFEIWNAARPVAAEERETYRALWQKLQAENGDIRYVTGEDRKLVSAPISFLDQLLLAACDKKHWRKVARIISDAMETLEEGDNDAGCAFAVLGGRVRKLAERGLLEAAGDLRKPGYSEVRLPARLAPIEHSTS